MIKETISRLVPKDSPKRNPLLSLTVRTDNDSEFDLRISRHHYVKLRNRNPRSLPSTTSEEFECVEIYRL